MTSSQVAAIYRDGATRASAATAMFNRMGAAVTSGICPASADYLRSLFFAFFFLTHLKMPLVPIDAKVKEILV